MGESRDKYLCRYGIVNTVLQLFLIEKNITQPLVVERYMFIKWIMYQTVRRWLTVLKQADLYLSTDSSRLRQLPTC